MENNGKTLSLTQLSVYLGISKRSLYNMIDDGRFPVPAIRGTSPRRWFVEDVDAWLKQEGEGCKTSN